MAKFKRILLKLSGESLMGEQKYGIDEKRLAEYAAPIRSGLVLSSMNHITCLLPIA